MEHKPLFSVLIANYNNGDYIQKTIDSILNQTYPYWEIIIVDDKSTDCSHQIYEKYYSNTQFHIYFNDKNMGCGYTKRKCVELAHGEICGFVDADDCITTDAIAAMVLAHSTHQNCSIIYSQYYITDNNLQIHGISKSQRSLEEGHSLLDTPGAISHFVSFKKTKYNLTKGINPALRCAEDLDLYYKLEEVGETLFIPQPLYYYRMFTGNNVSLGGNNQYKAIAYEILACADACQRRGVAIDNVITTRILSVVESVRAEGIEIGQNTVKSTTSFRIGKKILSPIKRIKKIFHQLVGS